MRLRIVISALLIIFGTVGSLAQAPQLIKPIGATGTKTPVFAWKHVGAQEYEIHMIAPEINRWACGGVKKKGCLGNRDPNAGCDKYYAFGNSAVLAACKSNVCQVDSAHPIPGAIFFSVLEQQCNGQPYIWKWSVRAKLKDRGTGPESPLQDFWFQPGAPRASTLSPESVLPSGKVIPASVDGFVSTVATYTADCVCKQADGTIGAHWARKPLGIGNPINQIIGVTAGVCQYIAACGQGGSSLAGGVTQIKVTNIVDTSGGMVYNYSIFGVQQ